MVYAEGKNQSEIVAKMKGRFRETLLQHKKDRFKAAEKKYENYKEEKSSAKQLVFSRFKNAIDALNSWVEQKTSQGMENAVFQFRDFENMTENDAERTIQKLIRLGEIDPNDL